MSTHKRFVLVEEEWFKKQQEPDYKTDTSVGDTRITQLQNVIKSENAKPANQLSTQKINNSVQEIMKIKSAPPAPTPPTAPARKKPQSSIEKALSQYAVSDKQMTNSLRVLKHLESVVNLKDFEDSLRDTVTEVILALTSPNKDEHYKLRDYKSVWKYLHNAGFQASYISNPAIRRSYERHTKTAVNWLE